MQQKGMKKRSKSCIVYRIYVAPGVVATGNKQSEWLRHTPHNLVHARPTWAWDAFLKAGGMGGENLFRVTDGSPVRGGVNRYHPNISPQMYV